MKSFLFIFFFILFSNLTAQIPPGYYNTATGSGYTLKTNLYNIIRNHTVNSYASLWTTFGSSDRDNQYENDNTLFDLYSENPAGADPVSFLYNSDQCGSYDSEGDCYNREHIVPQSVYNSATPMQTDAHIVIPVDGYVNGQRSNNPHGEVATAVWTSLNGSKRGSSSVAGYSGTAFEPLDDFKGDVARMYFYFVTRYENLVAGYTNYPMFDGSSTQVFQDHFLSMLLDWHIQDPVSSREIARNNAVYVSQNNRNPFIDHPDFVLSIWAPEPQNQIITFPILTNQVYGNPSYMINAVASSGLAVNYSSSNEMVAVVSGSTISVTGVGSAVITANQPGNESYHPAPPVSRTLTVTPKLITVLATVNNKVYDGTSNATISGVLSGLVNNDNVAFNGTGLFNSPHTGSGKPVASTSVISGIDAHKYTLVQPTGLTGNILPKMITIY